MTENQQPQTEQPEELSFPDDTPDYSIRRAAWLKTSGIPPRFLTKTFDDFKATSKNNKEKLEICRRYAAEHPLTENTDYPSIGLISPGVWGVGKTHLVCAIAKDLIMRCKYKNPVLYLTEPDMLRMVRATFDRRQDTDTEDQVIRKLTSVPLLIVDDVGKEDVSDPRFVQRVWFAVVNGRYDNLLPMVLTANLSPDEIANHLGGNRGNEATFDRIYEMTQGIFHEITGESYRRGHALHTT